MGLITVKTEKGFDKIAKQVLLLPADRNSSVERRSFYDSLRPCPEVVVPFIGTVLRGFYLDRNVSGQFCTIPERTIGYVHWPPAIIRHVQPWANVEVPLDKRAYTMEEHYIHIENSERTSSMDDEALLRSIVTIAILLTVDQIPRQRQPL